MLRRLSSIRYATFVNISHSSRLRNHDSAASFLIFDPVVSPTTVQLRSSYSTHKLYQQHNKARLCFSECIDFLHCYCLADVCDIIVNFEMTQEKVLYVKHLPSCLTSDEKSEFLKYFGASQVRVMPDRGRLVRLDEYLFEHYHN